MSGLKNKRSPNTEPTIGRDNTDPGFEYYQHYYVSLGNGEYVHDDGGVYHGTFANGKSGGWFKTKAEAEAAILKWRHNSGAIIL